MVTKTNYKKELVETMEFEYLDEEEMNIHIALMENHGWLLDFAGSDYEATFKKYERL